jgi:competence ComEA-like helix-hairpin-helix protein
MKPAPPAPTPPAPLTAPPASLSRWPRTLDNAPMLVLGACLVLLAQASWQRFGGAGRPTVPISRPVVDLNQADAATLGQLPGIGPKLASRILAQRDAQGPFAASDDLLQVPGIGPARVERLRPVLENPETRAGERPRTDTPRSGSRKTVPVRPLNLNVAIPAELCNLPGIGPVLADRIVAERTARGPFRDVEDLKRVKGIKDKTLEKLRPYVTVDDTSPVAGA